MKNFKSLDGTNKRIALLTGHTIIIGPDWTPVHERFHPEAYSCGCISEDQVKNLGIEGATDSAAKTLNKMSLKKSDIRTAIIKLINENKIDAFTSGIHGGKPKSSVLSEMIGTRVMNSERDAIWYKMQEEGFEALKDESSTVN